MRGNTAEIGREPKTEEVAEESKDNEDHLTVRYTVRREVTRIFCDREDRQTEEEKGIQVIGW